MFGSIQGRAIEKAAADSLQGYKERSFKETVGDRIAHHKSEIAKLEAVLESMSPEVEKFVEAFQRARL